MHVRARAVNWSYYWFGCVVGMLLGQLLFGCAEPPVAAAQYQVKRTLDPECKDAIRTYNLLDKAAEAYWYAHNHDAANAVYDEIVKHIDAHRRCFW